MEQPHAGEGHHHAVLVGGGDDVVIPDGATRLGDVQRAGLAGPLHIVAEGEEGIGAHGQAALGGDPGLFLLRGQRLGLDGEGLLPGAVGQDVLVLVGEVHVDGVVPVRAADVLRSVDVVFTVISPNASNSVSQSVVDYLQPRGEVRLQVFSMSRDKTIREEQVRANAEAIIAELRAGHDCAFATLGDAMTYSTFGYVLEIIRKAIPNLDLEVIPGITSFATLTAKAGTVLVENGEQLRIIPSFRAEMAEALDFPKGSTTILLKSYRSRGALLDRLAREEKGQVLYGEHLAMKEQALLTDPDAIRARPEKYLSLIMVKKQ